eukprot:3313960-Alexandrium_andersonii.AAC.1
MVEEASLPHVVHVVNCLPHHAPLKLCANVVPNGPEGRVSASANSEHGPPEFTQHNIAGNKVPVLVLHPGRRKVVKW